MVALREEGGGARRRRGDPRRRHPRRSWRPPGASRTSAPRRSSCSPAASRTSSATRSIRSAIHLQLIARKLKKIKGSRARSTRSRSPSASAARRSGASTGSSPISSRRSALAPRTWRRRTWRRSWPRSSSSRSASSPTAGSPWRPRRRPSLPKVMADRGQLKQVFFNLTKNAMEAMQPGGRLKIRSRADDDSVYLALRRQRRRDPPGGPGASSSSPTTRPSPGATDSGLRSSSGSCARTGARWASRAARGWARSSRSSSPARTGSVRMLRRLTGRLRGSGPSGSPESSRRSLTEIVRVSLDLPSWSLTLNGISSELTPSCETMGVGSAGPAGRDRDGVGIDDEVPEIGVEVEHLDRELARARCS